MSINERIRLLAVEFLERDTKALEARVKWNNDLDDDEAYKASHMAAEYKETARRMLADAVIEADRDMTDRVRKVVKFPANSVPRGSVMEAK